MTKRGPERSSDSSVVTSSSRWGSTSLCSAFSVKLTKAAAACACTRGAGSPPFALPASSRIAASNAGSTLSPCEAWS